MCRSQDIQERSMKVGHLVLRLMGLQGAADNGKDHRTAGKLHREIHLQSGGISGPSPCWFSFSPCTFLGPSWVTNKTNAATFNIDMEKPQYLKHFYNNAIKVEGVCGYAGSASWWGHRLYRGETGWWGCITTQELQCQGSPIATGVTGHYSVTVDLRQNFILESSKHNFPIKQYHALALFLWGPDKQKKKALEIQQR